MQFNLNNLTPKQKQKLAQLLNVGTGDDYPDSFCGAYNSWEEFVYQELAEFVDSNWTHCFDFKKAGGELALDYESATVDLDDFPAPWNERFNPWNGKIVIWRK